MRKLLLFALSLSLFACNKEDEKIKEVEFESLFPLKAGNEWRYKLTNGFADYDTLRVLGEFNLQELNIIENNLNVQFKNKEIVDQFEWFNSFNILYPQICNSGNYTISGLQYGDYDTLFASPMFKKVSSDEIFYIRQMQSDVHMRFASSTTEMINGYSAFLVVHYTINNGDTTLKNDYYISPGIGIVRMKLFDTQYDLVSYKLN